MSVEIKTKEELQTAINAMQERLEKLEASFSVTGKGEDEIENQPTDPVAETEELNEDEIDELADLLGL